MLNTGTVCSVCGTPKVGNGSQTPVEPSPVSIDWNCAVCTMLNPAHSQKCSACGSLTTVIPSSSSVSTKQPSHVSSPSALPHPRVPPPSPENIPQWFINMGEVRPLIFVSFVLFSSLSELFHPLGGVAQTCSTNVRGKRISCSNRSTYANVFLLGFVWGVWFRQRSKYCVCGTTKALPSTTMVTHVTRLLSCPFCLVVVGLNVRGMTEWFCGLSALGGSASEPSGKPSTAELFDWSFLQLANGPCGVLAAVHALQLRYLLFPDPVPEPGRKL